MQDQFSNWYARMTLSQDAELAEHRWGAIQQYVKNIDKTNIAMLAKLAFRVKPQMSSPEVATLREALAGEGGMPGDDELIMLSASTLASAIHSANDATAALAATLVACVSCGGLRKPKQPMDLIAMADNILRSLSETSRRRPSLEKVKFVTPTVDKDDETILQAVSTGEILQIAQAIAALTDKALSAMARRQREFEANVQKYVNIQDEELDILWWLEGGYSFGLNLDFSKIMTEHRPLAIACELEQLVKVLPGPPALASLFSRTGLQDAELLSIPNAVQSMPQEWLNSVVEGLESAEISAVATPILFSILRRHEVDGADNWIEPWYTTTGLPREAQLSPLQIATAAYREFSLVRL